jgi:hypothetical protein
MFFNALHGQVLVRFSLILSIVVLYACSRPKQPVEETRVNTSAAATTSAGPAGRTDHLTHAPEPPLYNLEQIGSMKDVLSGKTITLDARAPVTLIGWAVDGKAQNAAGGVDIVFDSVPYAADYGIDRPDVSEHFHISLYLKSGFAFTLPAGRLSPGKHTMSVRVLANDGKSYTEGAHISITMQ